MSFTEQLAEIPWGLIWPLIVIQLILMTAALIDLNRKRSTNGPVILWVFIIIFINTLGPVLYFTVGRRHS
ncbi:MULTISPECIES: PLD nuclease N-terminal domain-containing protein [Bhargavaea]|uniref:PLD nuclease N-terminal domain-containing protein n=1 Tax=Bhargavaea changchunensis TaxID=2134037 RepID=A0ABW2NC14_9BACL|nr:PLD nuclease N-terminal domain-containing protein [Bhargavaea sp. CC-171006]